MKPTWMLFIALLCCCLSVPGQVSPIPISAIPTALSNSIAATGTTLGVWKPKNRNDQSTEWERVQLGSNTIAGELELQTNRYTELANNLNFVNASGNWEPSLDNIMLTTNSGGAAALKGPTKVYFPPTIGGRSDGPITIVSPSDTAWSPWGTSRG